MLLPEYKVSDFGKVAVLMGGQSAERAISLESGQAVHAALCNAGVDAHAVDFNKNEFQLLMNSGFDRVFIALHGRGGEDGTIQGALETIGLPYTGSNVLASALAMDKMRSKAIWQAKNLPTPGAVELSDQTNWEQVAEELKLPIMVKPAREGSSVGASKVIQVEELSSAWEQANQYDNQVMAESWVEGSEYTIPILGDMVLPMIKLETKREFYDYQAKYEDDDTKYICPCGLDENVEKTLGGLAVQACKSLGVTGWSRVDLMIDKENKPWLIEVNTVPGMTSHSLVPMAAKQAGISFEQLVVEILATSLVMPVDKEFIN
ncbi:MAG: D-alanine--D-alanine ligase [Proteobacteria bacterium]|nr:D-alanine--D-alanine ligase [Pseudomonadota bacterium]NOG60093.1 D-alanine--D-alanine ligase [Pseudomonadota bacterium]